jgi:hypothetical protein
MQKLKFLFALSFILILAACGGGSDAPPASTNAQPAFSVTVSGE